MTWPRARIGDVTLICFDNHFGALLASVGVLLGTFGSTLAPFGVILILAVFSLFFVFFVVVLRPFSVRTLSSLGPRAELLPEATDIDA